MEITPKAAKSKPVDCSPCHPEESSPGEYKREQHQQQQQKLSSSLKERLKRCRRSFTSPYSVAKRLCVDEEEGQDVRQVPAESRQTALLIANLDENRNEARAVGEKLSGHAAQTSQPPTDELDQLRKEVKDRTENLRRLRMVQMYRSKNDLTQLQTLIDKWRSCAQAALYQLQSEVPINGGKGSLSELIDLFGLDHAILHFDRTEEDFSSS